MIRAKKSLGQNFLIDQKIIDKIINIVDIKDKSILDVGCGDGELMKFIYENISIKIYFIVEPVVYVTTVWF